MKAVATYLDWMKHSFGTTRCMDRNNTDFHKVSGQLLYFTNLRKMLSCVFQAGRTIDYLTENMEDILVEAGRAKTETPNNSNAHCAVNVLQQVRERTGVGNQRLERIAHVLDGGVGLSGGLCGALSGAVIAINLLHGFNLRKMSYMQNLIGFFVGHVNLMRSSKPFARRDTFFLGKTLVTDFKEKFGSIECRDLTGRTFADLDDFRTYMGESAHCREMIRRSAALAADIIDETMPGEKN